MRFTAIALVAACLAGCLSSEEIDASSKRTANRQSQFSDGPISYDTLKPPAVADDGNRLSYLDDDSPYYVSQDFPKLTTPQWVGDDGVEAVVILAIDDMRDPAKYEAFLRPILKRLKEIDGRAPVSIMTNNVKPDDQLLRQWLGEGLSIEAHTIDHPCPLLQQGDFAKAKSNYDRCVEMAVAIPDNKPVAFRMPCCDSLNTVSPRFFAEIFNRTTDKGRFLQIDSSVANVFTPNDAEIPRDLIFDANGIERFKKYVPYEVSFVNAIENYPYPYVVDRLCWELPYVAPSDWAAQNYHMEKASPQMVGDLKAALDITVLKQGVLTLVFHPVGWIRNDQIVEIIDHAVTKFGPKVKFLTFHETLDRLNENLLSGQPVRDKNGHDNGVRLMDVNNDGFLDVVVGNEHLMQSRIWAPEKKGWSSQRFPIALVDRGRPSNESKRTGHAVRFGLVHDNGMPTALMLGALNEVDNVNKPIGGAWHFDGTAWVPDTVFSSLLSLETAAESEKRVSSGAEAAFRDLDHDGISEIILGPGFKQANAILDWSKADNKWRPLPFTLPDGVTLTAFGSTPSALKVGGDGVDSGLRFVDIDEDGNDDVVFSNAERFSIHLFESMRTGWSKKLVSGDRGKNDPRVELPMIVRKDGTSNGFWVHSRHLWWQNEDTAKLKDHVDRRSYDDLLKNIVPASTTPGPSFSAGASQPARRLQ